MRERHVPRLVPEFTAKERKEREQAHRDSERFIRLAKRILPKENKRMEYREVEGDDTRMDIVKIETGEVIRTVRRCMAQRIDGGHCRSMAINHSEHCFAHSTEEELERAGAKPHHTGPVRSRMIRALDQLVIDEMQTIYGVYTDGLRAVDPLTGRADHSTRMKAAEALLDRTQGKATSRTEISGKDGENLQLEHLMASNPGEATDSE